MTRIGIRSFDPKRVALCGLAFIMTCALGLAPVAADEHAPLAPDARHVQKAQLIGGLLSQHHYRTQVVDDELSKTVFDAYLSRLDRDRYFFLEEDIESFDRYRDQLDDGFRRGDLTGAYRIFSRYQQRVEERVDYALSLLASDLDFDDDETIRLDRSEVDWAADTETLDAAWRKRVKHDALTLRLADQEWDRVYEILQARYERMARVAREHSAEEVFEIYMNAWAQTFDPHTAYMSPRLSENFDIQMRLSLEGIGAVLRSENDMTEVVELVPGGPAASNGNLRPGDRILGVAQGGDGEMEDVVGWRLEDVVDLIRGPKESTVRLQVLPTDDTAPTEIVLVRNEVKLEEQAAQAKRLEVDTDDGIRHIGVISVPVFYMDFHAADAGDRNYRSTTRDVRRLIEGLEEEGIDGLVVDLRGNGGGSLREATDMTGLFMPGAQVVQIRRSDGDVEILRDSGEHRHVAYDGPLAVLVDGFSASASEIFAAAVQDHGRGIVVGQQTFGKGTVQNLIDLDHFGFSRGGDDPMGRLKLTIAKFYRVSGGSTQQLGVEPDIRLPGPFDASEFGEKSVSNALPWGSIKALDYPGNSVLRDIVPTLGERHEGRTQDDPAYQALVEEYAFMRDLQRNRETAPLTEAARRAERERQLARQLEYVNLRRDAYGLEALEELDVSGDDELPDTLLESTASIVADLHALLTADRERVLQARHLED